MSTVVIAHDYVTQRGGAERVVLALLACFPTSPLLTSVYAPDQTFPGFRDHFIKTSPLQGVPRFRQDPRLALPILAAAWNRMRVTDADVVLASSSGWAHGVAMAPGVHKVVYCHNPARWLYQQQDYLGESRLCRTMLRPFRPYLTRWDGAAARSADRYLANSTVVADRIRRTYGIDAEVLAPPVSVDVDGAQEPIVGVEPGYFLTVARGRGYKNTEIVEEAISMLPSERLVVVGAEPRPDQARSQVQHVGVVSDAQLRWLYANARALVSVAREDFGLTPIEANAFGTPALLLRAGGFLDTMNEGVSGLFIEQATASAVRDAARALPDLDRELVCKHADTFSPQAFKSRLYDIVADVAGSRTVELATRSTVVHLPKPGDRRRNRADWTPDERRRRSSDDETSLIPTARSPLNLRPSEQPSCADIAEAV